MQEVIVFGGGSGGVDQTSTWAWDGTNWTQLPTVKTPAGREQLGTVWDPASHELLIFDGHVFGTNQLFSDTWKFVSH